MLSNLLFDCPITVAQGATAYQFLPSIGPGRSSTRRRIPHGMNNRPLAGTARACNLGRPEGRTGPLRRLTAALTPESEQGKRTGAASAHRRASSAT